MKERILEGKLSQTAISYCLLIMGIGFLRAHSIFIFRISSSLANQQSSSSAIQQQKMHQQGSGRQPLLLWSSSSPSRGSDIYFLFRVSRLSAAGKKSHNLSWDSRQFQLVAVDNLKLPHITHLKLNEPQIHIILEFTRQ